MDASLQAKLKDRHKMKMFNSENSSPRSALHSSIRWFIHCVSCVYCVALLTLTTHHQLFSPFGNWRAHFSISIYSISAVCCCCCCWMKWIKCCVAQDWRVHTHASLVVESMDDRCVSRPDVESNSMAIITIHRASSSFHLFILKNFADQLSQPLVEILYFFWMENRFVPLENIDVSYWDQSFELCHNFRRAQHDDDDF